MRRPILKTPLFLGMLLAGLAALCLDYTGGQLELTTAMSTSPWAPQDMTSTLSVHGGSVDLKVGGASDFSLWGQVPGQSSLVAPQP